MFFTNSKALSLDVITEITEERIRKGFDYDVSVSVLVQGELQKNIMRKSI